MLVTVAICTLNRAESLRRTLESLAAMRVPDGLGWEVVVVNNGCTDHTDAVIESFAGRLPIRREFEEERGLSRARNRAIDVARGDYILWTDDDVIVDPLWLAAYAEAFRRWPDAAVFGGPIRPRYSQPVPAWILESGRLLDPVFSLRDLGDEAVPLSTGREPYGANFAVRMIEQRNVRYDPTLGLQPRRWLLGEDVEVIGRILKSGGLGFWVPDAPLEHCIAPEKQNVRFVLRRFAADSETLAFFSKPKGDHLWFGTPRWLWRRLVECWLSYRIHRVISPTPVWLSHLSRFGRTCGVISYWRNRHDCRS